MACLTDVGRQRANNEDSYLYWEPDTDEEFRRKGRLAVIADGMGGYEGGQEASRLAVETVRHIYDSDFAADPAGKLCSDAFASAHDNIQRYAEEHPQFHGMGTTCTAMASWVVNSPSRTSGIAASTWYDETLSPGSPAIIPTLAASSRAASFAPKTPSRILSATSSPPLSAPGETSSPTGRTILFMLEEGDSLLLCTDGLWSLVAEQDLASVVRSNTPAEACAALVQMALERGGPDNVTVLILRIAA